MTSSLNNMNEHVRAAVLILRILLRGVIYSEDTLQMLNLLFARSWKVRLEDDTARSHHPFINQEIIVTSIFRKSHMLDEWIFGDRNFGERIFTRGPFF